MVTLTNARRINLTGLMFSVWFQATMEVDVTFLVVWVLRTQWLFVYINKFSSILRIYVDHKSGPTKFSKSQILKYLCSFLQHIREHRHIETLCWWNQLGKFRYSHRGCYYRDSVEKKKWRSDWKKKTNIFFYLFIHICHITIKIYKEAWHATLNYNVYDEACIRLVFLPKEQIYPTCME